MVAREPFLFGPQNAFKCTGACGPEKQIFEYMYGSDAKMIENP